jgi:hypothetical protein
MGASAQTKPPFSREQLLSLVATARRDFLLRDRDQHSPAWFPDKSDYIESTTTDIMSSDSGSSNTSRIRITTLKDQARLKQLRSDRQNWARSDTLDFSSSSDRRSRSPDAINTRENGSNFYRTRSNGASLSDLTTSPLAGKTDAPSFQEDFDWTPSDSDIDNDSEFLAEIDYSHYSQSYAPKLPYVPTEVHRNGRNDVMSGAVGLLDTPLAEDACKENNFMYLPSLWEAMEEMPLKVLKMRDLVHTFSFPVQEKDLPDGFCITIIGLVSAVLELQQLPQEDFEPTSDARLILALAKRGGTCQDDVVYPENIQPLIGALDPEFDESYWRTMWAQAG